MSFLSKKEKLFLSGCVILLTIAVASLFIDFDSAENQSNAKKIGNVTSKKNDTRRKSQEAVSFSRLNSGQRLYLKDEIFSGEDSQIKLSLDNGVEIQLGENSLITLNEENGDIEFNLVNGAAKVVSQTQQEEIKAPKKIVIKANHLKKTFQLSTKPLEKQDMIAPPVPIEPAFAPTEVAKVETAQQVAEVIEPEPRPLPAPEPEAVIVFPDLKIITAFRKALRSDRQRGKVSELEVSVGVKLSAGQNISYSKKYAIQVTIYDNLRTKNIQTSIYNNRKIQIPVSNPTGHYTIRAQYVEIHAKDRKLAQEVPVSVPQPVEVSTKYSDEAFLGVPHLQTPRDKQVMIRRTNVESGLWFVWGPLTGADFYEVQISKMADFSAASVVSLKENQIELSSQLYSGKWYWRVRGCNKYFDSQWSETKTFTLFTGVQ